MPGLVDYDSDDSDASKVEATKEQPELVSKPEAEQQTLRPRAAQSESKIKTRKTKAKISLKLSAVLPAEIRNLLEGRGGDIDEEEDEPQYRVKKMTSTQAKSSTSTHALIALLPQPKPSAMPTHPMVEPSISGRSVATVENSSNSKVEAEVYEEPLKEEAGDKAEEEEEEEDFGWETKSSFFSLVDRDAFSPSSATVVSASDDISDWQTVINEMGTYLWNPKTGLKNGASLQRLLRL